MVRRRPKMSDRGESATAPMIMPKGAALNSRPRSVGFSPHAFEIPAAVKEAIMMSKPSTMLMATQIAMAITCIADIGRARRAWMGLVEADGVMPHRLTRLVARVVRGGSRGVAARATA
jgi:hypothetical protein